MVNQNETKLSTKILLINKKDKLAAGVTGFFFDGKRKFRSRKRLFWGKLGSVPRSWLKKNWRRFSEASRTVIYFFNSIAGGMEQMFEWLHKQQE